MNTYRIIEISGVFYPQKKMSGSWFYMAEWIIFTVQFKELYEAQQYLDKIAKSNFKIKVHDYP